MNRFFLLIGGAALFAMAGVPAAAEPLAAKEVATWVDLFNTHDGLTRMDVAEKFNRQVTPPDRAEALAQIMAAALRRKKPDAAETALSYLSRANGNMPWSTNLARQVEKAAKHPNANLRAQALRTYALRPNPEKKAAMLRFLEDQDESIRQQALIAVRDLPDRNAIYEGYVRKNRGVEKRRATVNQANFLLDRSQKGQLE